MIMTNLDNHLSADESAHRRGATPYETLPETLARTRRELEQLPVVNPRRASLRKRYRT